MNIYVKINKLIPNSTIEDRSFSADALTWRVKSPITYILNILLTLTGFYDDFPFCYGKDIFLNLSRKYWCIQKKNLKMEKKMLL